MSTSVLFWGEEGEGFTLGASSIVGTSGADVTGQVPVQVYGVSGGAAMNSFPNTRTHSHTRTHTRKKARAHHPSLSHPTHDPPLDSCTYTLSGVDQEPKQIGRTQLSLSLSSLSLCLSLSLSLSHTHTHTHTHTHARALEKGCESLLFTDTETAAASDPYSQELFADHRLPRRFVQNKDAVLEGKPPCRIQTPSWRETDSGAKSYFPANARPD